MIGKREFAVRVGRRIGCTQQAAEKWLQGFSEEIIELLSKGNEINIPRFGIFKTKIRKGRRFKSHLFGLVQVDEQIQIGFKPSRIGNQNLKQRLQEDGLI